MVYSHLSGMGPDPVQVQMESVVQCRNFHTDLKQGQVTGPIVSYRASPIPCTGPGPAPVQCE